MSKSKADELVDYQKLCEGNVKSFSHNLVDISLYGSFLAAEHALKRRVDRIFQDIEREQKNKQIQAFTIGKAIARTKVMDPVENIRAKFDRNDPDTWDTDGVRSRWNYYKNNHDYDGLVCLTAVRRDVIPSDITNTHKFIDDVQQYALALEQRLIQYFVLEKPDPRCENHSFHPGHLAKNPYAGLVYVAYKLKDKGDNSTREETLTSKEHKYAPLPELIEAHQDNSEQRLLENATKARLQIRPTPKDGNCFYRSVADQLSLLHPPGELPPPTAEQLRTKVVAFMREHPILEGPDGTIELRNYVADEEDWDSYCQRMSMDEEWADALVVTAMAQMLQHDILVITSSPQTSNDNFYHWVFGRSNFTETPITIGHEYELHYVSLVPTDEIQDEEVDSASSLPTPSPITTETSTIQGQSGDKGRQSHVDEDSSVQSNAPDETSAPSSQDNTIGSALPQSIEPTTGTSGFPRTQVVSDDKHHSAHGKVPEQTLTPSERANSGSAPLQKADTTSPKKYVCETCQKSYTTKSHLKRHIKNVHENKDKVECEICKKKVTKKYLAQHKRTQHGEE